MELLNKTTLVLKENPIAVVKFRYILADLLTLEFKPRFRP